MRIPRLLAGLILVLAVSYIPVAALAGGGCHVTQTIGTDTFFWTCTTGDDVLVSGPQEDHVPFREGHDTGTLGGGPDSADGGAGNDLIRGQGGNDDIDGYQGTDRMVGGAGNDVIRDNQSGGDTDKACDGEGSDTINLQDGDGNDTVYVASDGDPDTILINANDSYLSIACPFST